MARKLKVYGWVGARTESRVEGNGHGQTREIVAAHSIAEVSRLSGEKVYYLRDYCSTTGNAHELEVALAEPGVVFWAPLNGPHHNDFTAVRKPEQDDCPDCVGTGEIILNPRWPSGDGPYSEKCSTCGGGS